MLLTMAACMAATLTFAIKSVVVIININNNNKNETSFFFIFFNCLVQIGPVRPCVLFVVEIFCFVGVEHYFYDGLVGKLCLVCFVCGNFVGSREGAYKIQKVFKESKKRVKNEAFLN